jgi:hypothetical protein
LSLFQLIWGASHAVAADDLRFGDIQLCVVDIYGQEELSHTHGLIGFAHRTLNLLHPATRERIINNELLFAAGDPFNEERLAETERNLRGLGFLTNVTITPLDTLSDGSVPVEVKVQETWTLTTQFSYSKSSSSDRWTALMSDTNFLGYGVQLEAAIGHEEDRDWRSMYFQNRRVLGTQWLVRARTTDLSDGYNRELGLERPFYAMDDTWGVSATAWDLSYKPRYYLSRTSVDPNDFSGDRLYMNPQQRREGVSLQTRLRISKRGEGRIWRIGAGLSSEFVAFDIPDEVVLSDERVISETEARVAAGEGLVRETGRTAQPFLLIETQGREWGRDRFVLRYGGDEDIPLDPRGSLKFGPALSGLGSDQSRWVYEGEVFDWSRMGPGWLLFWGLTKGSLASSEKAWSQTDIMMGWFGHLLGGMNRVVVEGIRTEDPVGTMVPTLGLTRGLRTLENDGLVGDRLVRWNIEHAILFPHEVFGFTRFGLAAFYAGGSAWWDQEKGGVDDARHEAGIGLRFGPSRSARTEIGRLDLAWPLDGSSGPQLTAKTGGFF